MLSVLFRPRAWFMLVVVAVACLLGYAYYVQYQLFLEPCPLCILQRVAFFAMACFALLAVIHNPAAKGQRVYGGLVIIAGFMGCLISGRHLWLQSLPADEVPECGPGLGYMLETFPLAEVWQALLHGSGSCATVDWTFIGLSMPAWTLVCYVVLMLGTLISITRKR